MKLGFRLIEVDTEDKEVLKIGTGSWIFHADITDFQKAFLADNISADDDKSILKSFRFIREGVLLALSRRISKKDDDSARSNETFWVFIPKEIKISDEEIGDVIEASVAVLSLPDALKDETAFENLAPEALTRDYPAGGPAFRTGDMTGAEFAVIDCNHRSPEYFISAGFQNIYSKYGFIVLNQSGVSAGSAPSISPDAIHPQRLVNLPKEWLQNVKATEAVKIAVNQTAITERGAFFEPGSYQLKLSRPGYLPVTIKVEVKEDSDQFIFPSQQPNVKWLKSFDTTGLNLVHESSASVPAGLSLCSSDAFNDKGQPITSFKYGDTIYVPENQLTDFSLSLNDKRYRRLSRTLDLTKPIEKIILIYEGETITATGEIHGNSVLIEIQGPEAKRIRNHGVYIKGADIRLLPREGMSAETGKTGNLEKQLKAKTKTIGMLFVAAACFLVAAVVFLILYLTKPSVTTSQPGDNAETACLYHDTGNYIDRD